MTSSDPTDPFDRRVSRGIHAMNRLSGVVDDSAMRPVVNKRGFVAGRLMTHWQEIVGDIAEWSQPAGMKPSSDGSGCTLKIAIRSGFGPRAQQMEQTIIESVNRQLGYRAVTRVVFTQTLHATEKKGD